MPTTPSQPPPPEALAAGLQRFNDLDHREAVKSLHNCCGSPVWSEAVAEGRPYPTIDDFFRAAQDTWHLLPEDQWLEAFSHHPRIGEPNLTQPRFAATAQQASKEQSGMAAATEAERNEFADLNARYEKKFGHVFLICATGKSAAFMLAQLKLRLGNDAVTELQAAAAQQSLITRIRLERMLLA